MIKYLGGTYNYKGIEMPEGGDMANEMSPNKTREFVQAWFIEDGWSIRQESNPDASWAFVADDGAGRKVIVGQRIGREDQLLIQAMLKIDDETQNRLTQLEADERNEWLWDLRFELVRTDLEFMGVEMPLKVVQVMGRICFDAPLTKDAFLNKVSQVRKGILIVGWMLAKKLGRQPSRKELGFHR